MDEGSCGSDQPGPTLPGTDPLSSAVPSEPVLLPTSPAVTVSPPASTDATPATIDLPPRPTSFPGGEKLTGYASYITFNSTSAPKAVKALVRTGLADCSRWPGYEYIKPNHYLLRCTSTPDGTRRYLLFLPRQEACTLFHNQLPLLMDTHGHKLLELDPRVSENPHFDPAAGKGGPT